MLSTNEGVIPLKEAFIIIILFIYLFLISIHNIFLQHYKPSWVLPAFHPVVAASV